MGHVFDVAARLDSGMESVSRTAEFVEAARAVGFEHPELADGRALVGLYRAEDGMDLGVLDADSERIIVAHNAVRSVADRCRELARSLTSLWSGAGCEASNAYLSRFAEGVEGLSVSLRDAHTTLESLRATLWEAVDGKVAALVDVDEEVAAQRARWLQAARAMSSGGGGSDIAHEVAELEILPYVQQHIATRWLQIVHEACTQIETAYERAVRELDGLPKAVLENPGELGPKWRLASLGDMPRGVLGVSAPGHGGASPVVHVTVDHQGQEPDWGRPAPPVMPAAGAGVQPPDAGAGFGSAPGSSGAGVPDLGGLTGAGTGIAGGIGSLVRGLVGALGSVVSGDAGDGLGEPWDRFDRHEGVQGFSDEDEKGDKHGEDDKKDEDKKDDEDTDEDKKDSEDTDEKDDAGKAAPAVEPPGPTPPVEPTEPQPPVPAPVDPTPPDPAPDQEGKTPCETGLDELPKAGG